MDMSSPTHPPALSHGRWGGEGPLRTTGGHFLRHQPICHEFWILQKVCFTYLVNCKNEGFFCVYSFPRYRKLCHGKLQKTLPDKTYDKMKFKKCKRNLGEMLLWHVGQVWWRGRRDTGAGSLTTAQDHRQWCCQNHDCKYATKMLLLTTAQDHRCQHHDHHDHPSQHHDQYWPPHKIIVVNIKIIMINIDHRARSSLSTSWSSWSPSSTSWSSWSS